MRKARWEWVTPLGLQLPTAKRRRKGRTITLSNRARDVLKRLPRRKGNGYLFPGRKLNGHASSFQDRWLSLLKRSGVESLQIRDLRRYFATLALSGGVPLDQVGQLLGHTQTQTTRRYAYLMTESRQEAAEIADTQLQKIQSIKPR